MGHIPARSASFDRGYGNQGISRWPAAPIVTFVDEAAPVCYTSARFDFPPSNIQHKSSAERRGSSTVNLRVTGESIHRAMLPFSLAFSKTCIFASSLDSIMYEEPFVISAYA